MLTLLLPLPLLLLIKLLMCDSGQFLNDVGRHAEAADSYLTASQLSHDDFELTFNTASALRCDIAFCHLCYISDIKFSSTVYTRNVGRARPIVYGCL